MADCGPAFKPAVRPTRTTHVGHARPVTVTGNRLRNRRLAVSLVNPMLLADEDAVAAGPATASRLFVTD
jgi:hypothetical protein